MKRKSSRLMQASSCAAKLKVLADPTRLAVLEALREGPRHVNTLMDSLNIAQSLLSHHLQALRAAGLVVAKRDGKAVLYSLTPTAGLRTKGGRIDLGCCELSFD